MRISRIVLSAALGLAIATPIAVAAQTTPLPQTSPAPRHHGGKFAAALRGIALSDQQKRQIQNLMAQYRQAHPKGSQPDKQARKQLIQSVYNILTPAQQAQYRANRARLKSERGTAPKRGRGAVGGVGSAAGGGMGRMFDGITLSDQQKQQIQALATQYRQEHPKGSQPDPQARQQLRQSILNVLTPAQQAQYNANRQRMKAERKANGSNAPFPGASPTPIP